MLCMKSPPKSINCSSALVRPQGGFSRWNILVRLWNGVERGRVRPGPGLLGAYNLAVNLDQAASFQQVDCTIERFRLDSPQFFLEVPSRRATAEAFHGF
jgi:hypothetical protein